MQNLPALNSVSALLLLAVFFNSQNSVSAERIQEEDRPFLLTYPNLDNPNGEVVLINEQVVLQRLVVGPGEWEGVHSHPGNQIYVHIKGGEWSGRLGGESEYSGIVSPDGEIGWMDTIPLSAGHDSGNTGDTPIDLIYVTLKGEEPVAAGSERTAQAFPDISADLLLENDRMIVQGVRLEPGQWTGAHRHSGNQVYIHITGGVWSERHDEVETASAAYMRPGSVGWLDVRNVNERHDAGNRGDATLEFILVTIK